MFKMIEKEESVVYEIKKSKFISFCYPVASVVDVDSLLRSLRVEHLKATHICYAYKIGGVEKCSDDGEPCGTAGVPMLDTIKKRQMDNILVVVVRYFGGIKLGAGGLIRAYRESVGQVLDKTTVLEKKMYDIYEIHLDYSNISSIKSLVSENSILGVVYGGDIVMTIAVDNEGILSSIRNILKDSSKIKYIEKRVL